MIVTIDGPAGAGKSTVAKLLAKRLGFQFLDTGAMYRVVALAGFRQNVDWDQPQELSRLATSLTIRFDGPRVFCDDEEVTDEIRSNEVTPLIRYAADNVEVRARLVDLQREFASRDNFVTEGRDQGTVAFPDAECKIFLTATPEERARRRVQDLEARGEQVAFEEILAQQNRRDEQDESRPVGRLMKADDAVEIVTDGMSLDEVVEKLLSVVQAR